MRYLIVILAVLAIAGCAKRPGSIKPAAMPADVYAAYSCQRIATDLQAERENLSAMSKKQHDAATGDAFMVFMIGVPVASLAGGDNEAQISISKGRIEALTQAAARNSCG